MTALDRDAAREVLIQFIHPLVVAQAADEVGSAVTDALDALEGCVRPAPAQTIDRDSLERLLEQMELIGPVAPDERADRIFALLRPLNDLIITCARCGRRILAETENDAENSAMEVCSRCMHEIDTEHGGVMLTREEAAIAASWYTGDPRDDNVDQLVLAQRLETAS